MDSFGLIIFGITGNLAQIKLIPALYDMEEKGVLPEGMSIVGNSRSPLSAEEMRDYFKKTLYSENKHHQHPIKEEVFEKLLNRVSHIPGNLDDPDFYPRLKGYLDKLTREGKDCDNRIYYLATYPELYQHAFEGLQKEELNKEDQGWVRLMIEKPIGNDLESAKQLNQLLHQFFKEEQIYRLDHYLGKETIQNILAFRFANSILEPLMNSEYIDHIQITASEDFGIGKRGGYYDKVGALKDVGQNHQLQMVAFATMDAPSEFTNEAVTKERLKILTALRPLSEQVVFGQYEGYLQEENVRPNSQTDTFYALKTEIEEPRFKGVPIYIRAGKMLKQTVTEISIVFKTTHQKLLQDKDEPNVLIYRIQPNEGIVLKVFTKRPGQKLQLDPEYIQYCYPQSPDSHALPDPYEKLLLDAIEGDQTFFNDAEEVEAQWAFIDPLTTSHSSLFTYKPGTWGPKEAGELIEQDGRKWLEPSMDFCRI
jgi:glucose-6-phosphate 1-dehydrogenase